MSVFGTEPWGFSEWWAAHKMPADCVCAHDASQLLCSSSGTEDVKGLQLLLGTHNTVEQINRHTSDQTQLCLPLTQIQAHISHSCLTEVWRNELSVFKCKDEPSERNMFPTKEGWCFQTFCLEWWMDSSFCHKNYVFSTFSKLSKSLKIFHHHQTTLRAYCWSVW